MSDYKKCAVKTNCCIVCAHPFWSDRLGSGALIRSRYKMLSNLFDEVFVLFITRSEYRCPLKGATMQLRGPFTKNHKRAVQKFLDDKDISLCYFSYDIFGELVRSLNCLKFVEIHDIMHLRQNSFTAFNEIPPVQKSKDEELSQLQIYDSVICINIEEASYLESHGLKSVFLPPSTDIHQIVQPEKGLYAGMIASSAKPNADGLQQIINCYSHLDQLIFAGSIGVSEAATIEMFPSDRITNLRYVDNPIDFYSQINIALVPIRFGAGLKIKLLEALSYGCNVLCTSHSAQGFPKGIEDVVTIADEPMSWEIDIFERSKLISKEKIHDYVVKNFSTTQCEHILLDLLSKTQ